MKDITQNINSPLEILREAISNCYDAEAKTISITIYRDIYDYLVVEIKDDGRGMEINDIHRFFNLEDSIKSATGIGEKGLGTKTYFKSERITLLTQTKENISYKVIMDQPWRLLNNNSLPKYTVEDFKTQPGKTGTAILIKGYKIDNPEKYFNFDTIKDYVLWFTAAGSFKTYFENYTELHKHINNMQIVPRIFIKDEILHMNKEVSGVHPFYPPNENPKRETAERIYKESENYCRHFGPYHKSIYINGEYVSFQIYGTISGENCRKKIVKLRQGESMKSRFGIYLAKNFIPFAKKINLMSDSNVQHYHLLVNSQAFVLTINKNGFTNQDDPKVKWVFTEVKKIINEDIIPLANDGYFKLRKSEEVNFSIIQKWNEIIKRKIMFKSISELSIAEIPITKIPCNEAQVVLLFATILTNENTKKYINYINKIGCYSFQNTNDMICFDYNNKMRLVEVEYKLSNLFKNDYVYEIFDYVICWSVDLEINEKKHFVGNSLCLIKEKGEWIIKHGSQKKVPVIELKSIVEKIKDKSVKKTF
ncbi:ATP-binding protein [Clostridium sp.]|uniref:ATP-binding protein n=1 Tax=Clostridium sp. TaxID=1506 RepID=UPI00262BAB7F|nr:ATP-binding protein [uncultured Clostridium sp.]